MDYAYKPKGVCSQSINISLEAGIVTALSFKGGCNGNLKAIAALAVGQPAESLIKQLKGITCGFKKTSCPDQLCLALELMLADQAKQSTNV